MPPSGKRSGKKTAALPSAIKPTIAKAETHDMFEPRKKSIGIGNIQPRRDLSRFVKWPRYVRLQRQRRILKMRLKVPPALAQFSQTLDVHAAKSVFGLLEKYRPEERKAKAERLKGMATSGKAAKDSPPTVKKGLNHIVTLLESQDRRPSLVVIAHDVEPAETIVWLPELCRRQDVPYCIVKSKARLGAVVHMKTATCLALPAKIKNEDGASLAKIQEMCKNNFNEKGTELRRTWGGGIMGIKNKARMSKLAHAQARELAKKAGM